MFREAKKAKKGDGAGKDGPNVLAVLILSPMMLIVHLFLGGTYRVLMAQPRPDRCKGADLRASAGDNATELYSERPCPVLPRQEWTGQGIDGRRRVH